MPVCVCVIMNASVYINVRKRIKQTQADRPIPSLFSMPDEKPEMATSFLEKLRAKAKSAAEASDQTNKEGAPKEKESKNASRGATKSKSSS